MDEIDFLTGCLRKEAIDSTLAKLKAECDVDNIPLSVLTIDLDNFKSYNDKYGHMEGDEALKYFGSTLRLNLIEEKQNIFRFGGDEFIIAFPGKTANETYAIANSVMKNLKKRPFLSKGHIFRLSFSGGIASFPSDGDDIEEIVQKADKAMYFSKIHGRKRTTLYKHMLRRTIERVLRILIIMLAAAGGLFYFYNSPYSVYTTDWLAEKVDVIRAVLTPTSAKIDNKDVDLVYLNSGRIIRGIIIRDDNDELELSLNLRLGKGSVTVKKSEIKNIRKRPEKVPSPR